MSKHMAYAIDFGTSNSLIALSKANGEQQLIDVDPANHDPKIMRSIFFISEDGRWTYGAEAVDLYSQQVGQGRLIRSIKKYLPDETFQGTVVGGKKMSLVDIIAMFLKNLRQTANIASGFDIDKVVLGRPAVFSLNTDKDLLAENRLRAAALQAGFKDIHFCPEPVAAGLSLGDAANQKGKLFAICDFGGGTSDFTVIRFNQGDKFEVLSLGGVSLAGDAYDGSIMKHSVSPMLGADITYQMPMGRNTLSLPRHIINKLCSAPDINFIGHTEAFELLQAVGNWSLDADKKARLDKLIYVIEERLGYKLFEAIEKTKIKLSSDDSALFSFRHYDIAVEGKIVSSQFVESSMDVTEKILASLDQTIKDAGVSPEQIDAVVCTGGTTRIPALRQGLLDRFDQKKIRSSNEFHSVIQGLARRASDLCNQD
jgi:hypothetical chaperone protein